MSAASGNRRRIPRAERREQLLDVTLQLLADRGYRAVSMQAIAEAAGVTKPIVYRSFPGLPALLAALLAREQRRAERVLHAVVPTQPDERHPAQLLGDSLATLIEAAAADPLTWRLVLFPPEGTPATVRALVERRREAVIRRTRKLVAWGVRYLAIDEELDEELLARALVTAAQEHARMVLEDPDVDREKLVDNARRLFAAVAWRDAP